MKRSIAIVGGGISGLSLAYLLLRHHRDQYDVALYDKAPHLGGVMQTHCEEGFLFECGPRTFPYARAKYLLKLIDEVNLTDKIIEADVSMKHRYICHQGRLEKLPESFFECMRSPLLKGGICAIARDLIASKVEGDETIAAFFYRHVGSQLTEQLIDPFVKGIYGGDIHRLSIVSTFPFLKAMEQHNRSLILGYLKGPRSSKKKGLFTLDRGLGSLIEELSQVPFQRKWGVQQITFNESGVTIIGEDANHYDHVVLAVGAQEAKQLLPSTYAHFFNRIGAMSIATVNLGYHEAKMPVEGFGFLAPTSENEPFLGAVLDSSIFPDQNTTKDQKRITVMIGEDQRPLEKMSDEELKNIATHSVEKYLSIKHPDFARINRYINGLAQPLVGHQKNIEALQSALANNPITLHAPYISGTSVNACIQESYRLSALISTAL